MNWIPIREEEQGIEEKKGKKFIKLFYCSLGYMIFLLMFRKIVIQWSLYVQDWMTYNVTIFKKS